MTERVINYLDYCESIARAIGNWEQVAWYFNGNRTVHLAQLLGGR